MCQLLVPIVFAASVLAAPPVALPSGLKVCKRDPDLNHCLKSAVQSAIADDLVKGLTSLDVLPIDPWPLTSLRFNRGSGPVVVDVDFENLKILGMSKIVIESVDAQLNGEVKKLVLTVRTENALSLVGKYTVHGRVFILPISGTGDSRIDLFGVTASISFTGKTVVNDGNEYLVFNTAQLDLNPKSAKVRLENLFNGNRILGEIMNTFLNQNWSQIYKELKDPIQEAFAAAYIETANSIFTKVPYTTIFRQ